MVIKRYSIYHKAPGLDPHHRMVSWPILDTNARTQLNSHINTYIYIFMCIERSQHNGFLLNRNSSFFSLVCIYETYSTLAENRNVTSWSMICLLGDRIYSNKFFSLWSSCKSVATQKSLFNYNQRLYLGPRSSIQYTVWNVSYKLFVYK